MLIFLIIFHFVGALEQSLTIPQLSEIAAPIHQACLQISPPGMEREDYTTMICGKAGFMASAESPRDAQLHNQLSGIGLLHMMIFSAAQVFAIETIVLTFEKRFKDRRWRFATILLWWYLLFLVGCFLLMSGGAVRFIRILLLMIIRRTSRKFQLRWSPVQVITVAGLCTVPFCRTTANQLALAIGWIASLAAASFRRKLPSKTSSDLPVVTEPPRIRERAFFLLRIYVTLIPALLPFSVPHPFSILVNLVAAPAFFILTLPTALLGYALPFFVPLTDWVFRIFDATISATSAWMPDGLAPLKISIFALGFYIVFLTFIARRQEQVLA